MYTDADENLVVVNNLQKKKTMVTSNKLGLANIETKYNLLRQARINIRETETQFVVSVPLIREGGLEVPVLPNPMKTVVFLMKNPRNFPGFFFVVAGLAPALIAGNAAVREGNRKGCPYDHQEFSGVFL